MASDDSWIEVDSRMYITILKGRHTREVIKEHFEAYIYDQMREMSDMSKLYGKRYHYINAYEWLLANLYRVAGIQLYEDGEVRINITWDEILKNNARCMFLSESEVSNKKLDVVLYNELEHILVSGL